MYTNDSDLLFLSTSLYYLAFVVPIILIIFVIIIFSRARTKKLQKRTYITMVVTIVVALIIGIVAYSGVLKPKCCGEGYTIMITGFRLVAAGQ